MAPDIEMNAYYRRRFKGPGPIEEDREIVIKVIGMVNKAIPRYKYKLISGVYHSYDDGFDRLSPFHKQLTRITEREAFAEAL